MPQAPAPRVLVVDDDVEVRVMVAEFLNQRGFEVLEAEDGVEALRKVREARPAALVLDIMMPRLGGLNALPIIRALSPGIVIVVVTGVFDPELQRRAAAAGAHAVLLKPVPLTALGAILLEAAPARPEATRPPKPPDRARQAQRILVADDEADVRSMLKELLVDAGYEVCEAEDGVSAVKAVVDNAPAVALLDILMPGLSGVEAVEAIRAAAPSVIVIMVSGTPNLELARRALAYGAFDYVTKPVDFAYLLRSVSVALTMHELAQGMDEPKGPV
jgi:two-component system, sensor histidine kinase and response regulator